MTTIQYGSANAGSTLRLSVRPERTPMKRGLMAQRLGVWADGGELSGDSRSEEAFQVTKRRCRLA